MRFLSPIRHPDVEVVRNAWTRYVDEHTCSPELVRPYVLRAWERSRAAGCDARQARADLLSPAETEALVLEQAHLIKTTRPFLVALSRAAGADRHAVMLADSNGHLLDLVGDPETMADENFPQPGALLSESVSGANGVGTALAENGYVELVGPEHFIEGFHVFTCQGVPLQGPSCVEGILSMSVRRLETADRVRDVLFCASEATECELLAKWLGSMASKAGQPALERLRQDMIQNITRARLRLELAARQIASGSDATSMINAAMELSRSFGRQAAIWRDLTVDSSDPPEPQSIELADFVEDFVELMKTEARIAAAQFVWGRVQRVKVLEDRRALSRRLLTCFLSNLQSAEPGAVLEINTLADDEQGHVAIVPRATTPRALPGYSVTAPIAR